jgi:enediyne polyketide synthase
MSVAAGDPIAIVGIACEYPDASSPAELWENVLAGRRAFRRIPPERLSLDDYLSTDRAAPDAIYSTEAAVLEGYEFDRVAFRVSGPSFRAADFAHWLALDVACRAVADAGFDGDALPRDTAGVIVGNTLTGEFSRAGLLRLRWPFARRVTEAALAAEGIDGEPARRLLERIERDFKAPFEPIGDETLAGGLSNTIAGRICNHLDLHGGGYTVDGACAASLLAVSTACAQLAAGDLDVAVAGGVDLSLDPFELVGFAKVGALAADEMRVYDARSAGFWPGEGCGMVTLMRLSDARAQARHVHAVIRGWGMSSDGAGGLTRPEHDGQLLALRRAYRRAGVEPASVAMFEGHGTGTAVGDPTELRVLAGARGPALPGTPPAAIGSIKANIGHTKAAAGVAGLLKATMAVRERVIPPTTGADQPHVELRRAAGALRVVRDAEPWPVALPVRAGVSAMGFGGINTHLVVDGPNQAAPSRALRPRERMLSSSAQDAELFAFAAPTREALSRRIEDLRPLAPRLSRAEMADAAAVLGRGALDGRRRAAVVASTPSELGDALDAVLERLRDKASAAVDPRRGVFVGDAARPPRVVFLLPGQGSPSHVEGGALRRRFPQVAALYARVALRAPADTVATEVAQPAIVTASLAALRVMEAIGLQAAVAVGHSLGELTALAWAGVFDEPAAQRIAAARGRAMADLSTGDGAMASLHVPAEEAERLSAGLPLVVAGVNAPAQTVVAGPVEAVDALVTRARGRGVDATRLRVSHAFHSPLVAPAADALAQVLEREAVGEPERRVVSSVTGRRIAPGDDVRALLHTQVTSPVLFAEAVRAAAAGADLLVEVGPGAVLSRLARESVDLPAVATDAGGPSIAGTLRAAAAAWALGAPVTIDALFAGRFTRPFDPRRELKFLANPCERAAPTGPRAGRGPRPAAAPPATAHADGDPMKLVAGLIAERAELPRDAIAPGSRMLDDLHLTSIAVGEIAVEAARRLGLPPPLAPQELANATVSDLARALADPRARAEQAPTIEPPGAGPWVRPLALRWIERPLRSVAAEGGAGDGWTVYAPPGHPLASALERELRRAGGAGVALCVPESPSHADLPLLLAAAQAALSAPRLLVVQTGGGRASGLARSVHLEAPGCAVAVVSFDRARADAPHRAAAEALAATSFAESRYTAAGGRLEPVLRRMRSPAAPASLPVGKDDVVLVTGGAKGIAAECMLRIARASGASLAVIGRSPRDDPAVTAGLERMAAAGVSARYASADVCDPAAVRAAIGELGPVTAVVHAAGVNEPRALAELDEELLARTLDPKVRGLENVLAVVDADRLKLLVTFGSIIARMGLRGDAHYALANEWQTALTETFAREHPGCDCLAFESSVWAAVGMGERLGSIGALARQGVHAIAPDEGSELLDSLLRTRERPTAVIATGRFGRPPTLRVESEELPLLRFLEKPAVHYPGIELVVDAELAAEVDLYLDDHVLEGDRLLPAVIGLEAMAQTVAGLTGSARAPSFEDVKLNRPLVIPPGERTTIRIAALADGPDEGSVVVRSERTAFAVDHFSARWRLGATPPATGGDLPIDQGVGERLELDPDDLYGTLLFQSGRFRRVRGYRRLTAIDCVAEIDAAEPAAWFGRYLPQDLILGNPGPRDAALHAIQACIPHARVVPVAVRSITRSAVPDPSDPRPLVAHARERERSADAFVYDLVVTDADGEILERWDGLGLRTVGAAAPWPAPWPEALLAPFVERHLSAGIHVAVLRAREDEQRRARSERAVEMALGHPARLLHRGDGRPEAAGVAEAVSTAHANGLTLAVAGRGTVACDIEAVASRPWGDLLGPEGAALSRALIEARGEDADACSTRVWAAGECLIKAGVEPGAPLALAGEHDDGWLVLESGPHTVATYVAQVRGTGERLALAVLAEGADAGL